MEGKLWWKEKGNKKVALRHLQAKVDVLMGLMTHPKILAHNIFFFFRQEVRPIFDAALAVSLAEPLKAERRHNFRTSGSLAGSAAVTIVIAPPPSQTDDNILEHLGFPQQLIPASLLPLPQLPMMEPFGLGQLALPQVISTLMALFF